MYLNLKVKNVVLSMCFLSTTLYGSEDAEFERAIQLSLEQHKIEEREQNKAVLKEILVADAQELGVNEVGYTKYFLSQFPNPLDGNWRDDLRTTKENLVCMAQASGLQIAEVIKLYLDAKQEETKSLVLTPIDFNQGADPLQRVANRFGVSLGELNSVYESRRDQQIAQMRSDPRLLGQEGVMFVPTDLSYDSQIRAQFFQFGVSDARGNNCMLYSIIRNDLDLLAQILGDRQEAQRLIAIPEEGNRDFTQVRRSIAQKVMNNLDTKFLTPDGSYITLKDYLELKFKYIPRDDADSMLLSSDALTLEEKLTYISESTILLEKDFANVISVLYGRPIYVLTPALIGNFIDNEKDPHLLIPHNDYDLVMPDRDKCEPIFIHHRGAGGKHYSKLLPMN